MKMAFFVRIVHDEIIFVSVDRLSTSFSFLSVNCFSRQKLMAKVFSYTTLAYFHSLNRAYIVYNFFVSFICTR